LSNLTIDMPLLWCDSIRKVNGIEPYQHPDNSKPIERRGRKAMDLKLRALRKKIARLAKIKQCCVVTCLLERAWPFGQARFFVPDPACSKTALPYMGGIF
jgi:hypothetical protein